MGITNDNKYLICTNIENLVNPNLNNSIFLGEWCLPYNREKYVDIPIMDFIWSDRTKYEKAYFYCIDVFEDILKELAFNINKLFNLSFEVEFYRIILSDWLIHYIQQSYDKYLSIKKAYTINPNLITYIISDKEKYIPLDYSDYMEAITKSDTYNLQQYTQIVQYLNFNFKYIEVSSKKIQKSKYINSFNKIKYSLDKSLSFITSIFYKDNDLATVVTPYFMYDKLAKYKLLVKNKLKFILDDFNYSLDMDLKLDKSKRVAIKVDKDEFYGYLYENILCDIPLLYFENIQSFLNKIDKLSIRKTNVFYTTNAHYGNNIYKFFCAKNKDYIKRIISQHGGVNGTHLLSLEEIDHKLADYVFTFGWKDRDNEIPMYSFNMSLVKQSFKHQPIKKSILLISTGQSKILFRLHSSYSATEYKILIDNTSDFLSTVDAHVNYRKYPEHYGWHTEDEIEKNLIYKLTYDQNKSIINSYKSSDIVVSNHIGSTYLESMSLDIPTIVFCDENITKFRKSAGDMYKLLYEVGIFHHNGEDAAKFINSMYENDSLYQWWNSPKVIKVKKIFLSKYSNTTEDWYKKFYNKIEYIINDSVKGKH